MSENSSLSAEVLPLRPLWSLQGLYTTLSFLPDYTEHPKPKRRKTLPPVEEPDDGDDDDDEVAFVHDFVAGGAAGCASVVVGHPFDTIKVRLQTSNQGVRSLLSGGGVSSLFRGLAAPLSAATAINAVVFSSYGVASRLYDEHVTPNDDESDVNHDPWQKAMACGSFAGLMQCFIICPMEHIKCRLQANAEFTGSVQAIKSIMKNHGLSRLYQGFGTTMWREIPAFGLYFAVYDYMKDRANLYLAEQAGLEPNVNAQHSHTWIASAFAGGCAGCLSWAMVYPVDVLKTRIQTSPLTTPRSELRMLRVGRDLVAQHGWRYLFRGLGITMIRAFPVNGTIFPVYEFTLQQVKQWT